MDVIGTRLGADTPEPISDSPPADKPTPDEPPADKPAPDEPPADKPTPDAPPTDKPAPDAQDPDAEAPDVPEQDPSAGASSGLLVGISAAATIAAVVIILLYLIRGAGQKGKKKIPVRRVLAPHLCLSNSTHPRHAS